ncbi:type II toxin-antitoxin system RatA family toxin [Cytophaga aurantiaca]|uniref:type II toxin-antitoxin system RatA family toxin n=1 Tax=Cytophaga aurantiaca TaxID=29530 RepID=UPI000375149F|nr:SRPBCC family protein [Cytophaga aurantiaca]
MNQIKFSESIYIHASQERVFDYTQDYKNRLLWDTFLKKADLIDGATEAGLTVKAYCVAHNGIGMETEYVSFNRPKVTAVKMTKGPFMFKDFLGSWNFKRIGPEETEVIFLYSFTLRFPFNMLTPFIKRNLQNNVKQRLIDLKNNIEKK